MTELLTTIAGMTLGEIAGSGALITAGLFTVVQVSPIKWDPWTWLFSAIGRALNREVIAKVDKLEKDIKDMEYKAREREAKDARVRVLRFGDELIHNVQHTKEHFDDVLQDITDYEKYCEEHPEFENDRMQITAQFIKETYHTCMLKRTFLEP